MLTSANHETQAAFDRGQTHIPADDLFCCRFATRGEKRSWPRPPLRDSTATARKVRHTGRCDDARNVAEKKSAGSCSNALPIPRSLASLGKTLALLASSRLQHRRDSTGGRPSLMPLLLSKIGRCAKTSSCKRTAPGCESYRPRTVELLGGPPHQAH
jgi:hypothetical protein